MIPDWLLSLGHDFTPDRYLALTRIQGLLWTAADYVIIVYLLRIANLVRGRLSMRRHRFSWIVLAATVPFSLALPLATTGYAFFRLELMVTIPHFALIIYVCGVNLQPAARLLHELNSSGRLQGSPPRRRPPRT